MIASSLANLLLPILRERLSAEIVFARPPGRRSLTIEDIRYL